MIRADKQTNMPALNIKMKQRFSGRSFMVFLLFLIPVFIFMYSCTIKQNDDNYDFLIYGGSIIDGTGNEARDKDILIYNGEIIKIGHFDPEDTDVENVINAGGMVVTPGFIDSHAQGDPIATPAFRNFIAMGVTTIILGQDGISPANIEEWMTDVEEAKPALNIATLVGHSSIRDESSVKASSNPDKSKLNEMAWLVEKAMDAGCFGLSTGLESQPGSFSRLDELVAVAMPVAKRNGIIHSSIRSEDKDNISESLAELINQGRISGSAVHVSNMKIVYGKGEKQAEAMLRQMQEARESGIEITGDIYPYTASYASIGIIFPSWAKAPYNYKDVVSKRREELALYLKNKIISRNGPEATLLGTGEWTGKTLAQAARERNKSYVDLLIDDIGPEGASAAYFVMDQELQDRLLIDRNVMISSDGSPTIEHPRGYGSFARIISYYVREKKILSLEEAVYKMTELPAKTHGILKQKRGLIKNGFAADLLIFDPAKVKDKATFTHPHTLAEGFEYVMVNGTLVIANGRFTGERAGKMLRKNSD